MASGQPDKALKTLQVLAKRNGATLPSGKLVSDIDKMRPKDTRSHLVGSNSSNETPEWIPQVADRVSTPFCMSWRCSWFGGENRDSGRENRDSVTEFMSVTCVSMQWCWICYSNRYKIVVSCVICLPIYTLVALLYSFGCCGFHWKLATMAWHFSQLKCSQSLKRTNIMTAMTLSNASVGILYCFISKLVCTYYALLAVSAPAHVNISECTKLNSDDYTQVMWMSVADLPGKCVAVSCLIVGWMFDVNCIIICRNIDYSVNYWQNWTEEDHSNWSICHSCCVFPYVHLPNSQVRHKWCDLVSHLRLFASRIVLMLLIFVSRALLIGSLMGVFVYTAEVCLFL